MAGIAVARHDAVESADEALTGYRPHLDGIRAIAVYLVVAFHAGADRASGGFIGVDVFFVLSGFLVTRVLLGGWNSGSLSLVRFYARRVRRLLPAAVVVVVASAAMYSLVATPAELRSVVSSLRAALLYYENWHLIGESSNYFAADVDSNPVLHFWSLSIEEQFYLAWPLLLVGMLTLAKRVRLGVDLVRLMIAGAVLASLAWGFHLAESNISRAYYGSDARAYQLLSGALLAMSPLVFQRVRKVRSMAGVAVISLLAICFLGTSFLNVGPIGRGALTTLATVALLLSLEASDGPARRFLSLEPMTYLGKISYGTYLWHWPVIVVLQRSLRPSPIELLVVAASVATGLAALSSHLLELPIRTSSRLNRVPLLVIAAGLGASAIAALVIIPRIADSDSGRVGQTAAGALPATAIGGIDASSIDWEFAEDDKAREQTCFNKPVAECLLIEGDGPHVLLIGDSHALMYRPALEKLAVERGWTLSTAARNGCSWPEIDYAQKTVDERNRCSDFRADLFDRVIPELDPDVVVLGLRAPDDPDFPVAVIDDDGVEVTDDIARVVAPAAQEGVDRLLDDGRAVVILEPVPGAVESEDPLKCLSAATVVEECRFVASRRVTPVEQALRDIAAESDLVSSIDMDPLLCPFFPICDPVINGIVVRWNRDHITATYAESIADQLGAALEATGAVPPA